MKRGDYSGFGGFRLPILLGSVYSFARLPCFSGCRPHLRCPVIFYGNSIMNENQNLLADNDDFDDLDGLFAQFDGVALEGGVDAAETEDDCAGGACKI